MNSVKRTTEDFLESQFQKINACYEQSLNLLHDAKSTGDEVHAIQRLRPIMQRILELENQTGMPKENVSAVVQSSTPLTRLVNNQADLLRRLLQEIQHLEMKLTSKRTQISQVRDRQHRRQEMQTAYQQHK